MAHFGGNKKKNRKQIAKEQVGSTRCTPHDGEGRPTLLNLRCSASYPTHWKVVAFHFYLLNFVCVWASTYTCLRLQNICAVASLPVWSTVTKATSLRNICGGLCEETFLFFSKQIRMSGITVSGTPLYTDMQYIQMQIIYIYIVYADKRVWSCFNRQSDLANPAEYRLACMPAHDFMWTFM